MKSGCFQCDRGTITSTKVTGKNPVCPWTAPSYQLSSIWETKVTMSPIFKPSSPSFSGSKSYKTLQHGSTAGTHGNKKGREILKKQQHIIKILSFCDKSTQVLPNKMSSRVVCWAWFIKRQDCRQCLSVGGVNRISNDIKWSYQPLGLENELLRLPVVRLGEHFSGSLTV